MAAKYHQFRFCYEKKIAFGAFEKVQTYHYHHNEISNRLIENTIIMTEWSNLSKSLWLIKQMGCITFYWKYDL